jgi:CheY-like chemotaxis protein
VEVLKYIRSQESLKTLPVVVMSNAFAGSMGREASLAGATKMFAKNACGPKRLVKEVRDIFAAMAASEVDLSPQSDTTMRVKDFRKEVSSGMPARIATLRRLIEEMSAETGPARERLLEFHRAVHQFASIVSLAGFSGLAQLACALETLVKELHAKPQRINSSSLRTAREAVEMLGTLSARGADHLDEGISSPLILVVDDDAISRETTCAALEQARLRALSVDDPLLALKLAKENRFDLLLMDIQKPELNGFELSQQIRATAANGKTPIIFVTSLNDFEAHVRSAVGGGMDFIAKPIMLVELAVKALTCLMKNIPPAMHT